MSLWYLPLIPVYLALGKKGVMWVLVATSIFCLLQPDFRRMLKGLQEYKD